MSLENIQIKLEAADTSSIGSVNALLSEIAACLSKLITSGETSSIDLRSLPFAPGEYTQLQQTLGQGEVRVRIEAIDTSDVIETQYSGVWWVTHYAADQQVAAEFIEVTYVPEILKTHPADARRAIEALHSRLLRCTEMTAGDDHVG